MENIEQVNSLVGEDEVLITPDNPMLQYSGRLGYTENNEPELIYPCSYVKWHFRGTSTAVIVSVKRFYWDAFAGVIIDARQATLRLTEGEFQRIELGRDMVDADHMVTLFKRQDACNIITIHGIVVNKGAELDICPEKPERRIEVYGDSVSAGEVSEAVHCIAQPDPEGHEGCYSNSWYSYPWITARKLKAEIHDIAQGGIALMPGTGWFSGPDYVGLEQTYDKVKYYPDLANASEWDFSRYIPHVVIVAVGQNDANPVDFMKEDIEGERAEVWRKHYRQFILKLREKYPKALIICATTVLCHDSAWDESIERVVKALNGGIEANVGGEVPVSGNDSEGDRRIRHFLYMNNGKGTPGHIRIPEAEMMAMELSNYINSFGDSVWE